MLSIKNNIGSLPEGAYAWKKYSGIGEITVNFTNSMTAVGSTVILTVSCDKVDLSTQNATLFYGVTLNQNKSRTITLNSDGTISGNDDVSTTISGTWTYEPTTQKLTLITDYAYFDPVNIWNSVTIDTGQTFIDFTVSDFPTAYPDGGEQGGYWYEKVVEGIDLLSLLGYTKMAVDKFTFTSDKSSNVVVNHSLGEIPEMIIVLSDDKTLNCAMLYVGTLLTDGSSRYGVDFFLYTSTSVGDTSYYVGSHSESSTNSEQVLLMVRNSSVKFKKGVEYTLITMT